MKRRGLLFALLACLLAACITPAASSGGSPPPVAALPTASPGFAWWNDAVFYEIFVRSFYDSNGDGIGDLNGLIQKLDYLNDGNPNTNTDLGVTALWLMPIYPSPSYHGYDVTDYYLVNPQYGTLGDFKRLLREAHKRGIRVVIDFVMNHTSSEHPWFKQAQNPQSSKRNWYLWADTDPGGVGPWGETIWHPSAQGGYYYGVFSDGMPDLNYKNPDVVTEMEKVTRFWLQEMGADGLRVDGARYIVEDGKVLADSKGNHEWFKQFRTFYKGIKPDALTVGEVWTTNDAVTKYVQGDQLDLAFNFDLSASLVSSARSGSADAARLNLAIAAKLLPASHAANFLTNHDMNRVMGELGNDVNKAKRAATLLFTAPGTPFVYYGEELGQLGKKPDEDIRLPMQWSDAANGGFTIGTPWRALAADYTTKNVATESADTNSLWTHYHALIAVRQANSALRNGDGFVVQSDNSGVLALVRASKEQVILVINNLREEAVTDYKLTLDKGPLTANGHYTVQPIWGKGNFATVPVNADGGFTDYQPGVGLGPGETQILQLVPAAK